MSDKENDTNEKLSNREPWNPQFLLEPDPRRPQTPMEKIFGWIPRLVSVPVDWIHDNIVVPNRGPKYYWYHRKYGRAVPIDECYVDDYACMAEADIEFKRNRLVESEILRLLRERFEHCLKWEIGNHGDDNILYCQKEEADFKKADLNYFIKYGDLTYNATVVTAYMKQKHRMIFERRKALKLEKENAAKESETASPI